MAVPSPSRAHRLLPAPLLLLLAGVSPCAPDPAQADGEAYVAAMQPLLARNMAMTRQFVEIATEVKQGRAAPEAIARRFEVTLVPEATALRDAVAAVQPATEGLAATHQGLVEAWTGRVEVYQALHGAWGAGDLAAFDRADRRNLEVKAAEERYFSLVQQELGPRGLTLDPYP